MNARPIRLVETRLEDIRQLEVRADFSHAVADSAIRVVVFKHTWACDHEEWSHRAVGQREPLVEAGALSVVSGGRVRV